ncbi:MAG: GNAT family N-acetyltransferase [Pseudomonadota bacterium]
MLHFHKAELVDAQEIAVLINSAYRGESSREGWTTEADLLDGLRTTTQEIASMIKREDAFMLIGVLNDQIVATISCELQIIASKSTAHFGMIAVKPSLQNRGYGTEIIQAAEAMTYRQWRVAGFHMAVISIRNELIDFYVRLGFVRTGEFKEFPNESALWQPKVAGLNFEYLAKVIK